MYTILKSSPVMRYATAGDYQEIAGGVQIEVFDQGDEDKNFLIAIHELVEQYLCNKRGITNKMIDDFDFKYEENRAEDDDTSEPGDDPDCPYKNEHRFAMIVEQMMAHELGVDWHEYDENIKVYEPPTEG
jgi:hypothetical protein